jgi:hypothetical protein
LEHQSIITDNIERKRFKEKASEACQSSFDQILGASKHHNSEREETVL